MIFRSIVFNFALFIKFLNLKYWKVEVFVNRIQLIWFSLSFSYGGILRVSASRGFFIALEKAYEWYIYGNFCFFKLFERKRWLLFEVLYLILRSLFIKFLNVKYWKVEVIVNRTRLIWFSLSFSYIYLWYIYGNFYSLKLFERKKPPFEVFYALVLVIY